MAIWQNVCQRHVCWQIIQEPFSYNTSVYMVHVILCMWRVDVFDTYEYFFKEEHNCNAEVIQLIQTIYLMILIYIL